MIKSGSNTSKKDREREPTLQIPKNLAIGGVIVSVFLLLDLHIVDLNKEEKRTNVNFYLSILCSTPQTTTTTTTP